jgi:hypothetical protein
LGHCRLDRQRAAGRYSLGRDLDLSFYRCAMPIEVVDAEVAKILDVSAQLLLIRWHSPIVQGS